jgi:hypothetical protein
MTKIYFSIKNSTIKAYSTIKALTLENPIWESPHTENRPKS